MQQAINFDTTKSKVKKESTILDGLNDAQREAVTHEKGPLLIIAGAGTGKTTVITRRIAYLIEQKLCKPSEILALTFTEKAASEMEERVDQLVPYGYTDMWIGTFHAFGDRLLRDFSLDLGLPANFKILTATEQIIFMRQNIYAFDLNYYRPIANPMTHISALLNHFSRLKDELITPEQYLDFAEKKIKNQSANQPIDQSTMQEAEKTLELANAYQRYQDLMYQAGNLDFGDLLYLAQKLIKENKKVREECQNRFKYILVDEFQDTNFAQNELVKLLAQKDQNITVVGDDDQCLPGDSKILTPDGQKEIKKIKIADKIVTAVGRGHIGTSVVNKITHNTRKRRLIHLRTESGKEITVTDNHKMFCLIPNKPSGKYYVYLMERQNLGWRIGITTDLITRLRLERSADRIIGLRAFDTEDEAKFFEMLWSCKYAIPTTCFKERKGIAIREELLQKLYDELDTDKSAKKLAEDLGINLNAHHFCLDGVVRGSSKRLKIYIDICQRKYRSKNKKTLSDPKIIHQISLQTSSPEIIETLESHNYPLQKAKLGKRLRITKISVDEIKEIADNIAKLTGGIIEERFQIGFYKNCTEPAMIIPAGNVLEGHYLPSIEGSRVIYDKIIKKTEIVKTITTYDLEVDRTHNFVANSIFVHNSIYRFRGASISNIMDFTNTYSNAKQVVLNNNYRSTQEILDSSYKLISHNNPDRLEIQNKINKRLISPKHGLEAELLYCNNLSCEADKVVEKIKELKDKNDYKYNDFAILVRANSHTEPFLQSLNIAGIPYIFSGTSGLFSQPEIRMLVAFLKSLVYTDDSLSLYHLATSEIYNIGHETLAEYYTKSKRYNRNLMQIIEGQLPFAELKEETDKLNSEFLILNSLVLDIKKYSERKNEPCGEILYDYLKEKSYLKNLVDNPSIENEVKIHNIAKFFDRIAEFNHSSIDKGVLAFLNNLELILEVGDEVVSSDIDPDLDAVNILTAHGSKGLEWPVVFVVNCVSDRFPGRQKREALPIPMELIKERLPEGDFHIQEERRLFYVAATRAKQYLFLAAAEDYGGKRSKKLSQFVLELLDQPDTSKLKHKLLAIEKIERFGKVETPPVKLPPKFKSPIIKLSRQQIDDYFTCPKKFYFAHIVKIPLLENQYLMYGTAIHAALDHYFSRKINGETPTLSQLLTDYNTAFKNIGFITREHEELRKKQGIATLTRFFDEDQKNPTMPTQVEATFEFFENNVKVGGRYDLVCQPNCHSGLDPESCTPEIKDFKTSDVKEQKDADRRIKESTQMMIYALAWYEKFKIIPKTTLVFIESGLTGSKTFGQTELNNTKEMIFEVSSGIRKEDFSSKADAYQCKQCPYSDICPDSKN